MVYQAIAGLFVLTSIILLFVSVRLLANKKWVIGFLRGAAGLILLMVVGLFVLIAKDFTTYRGVDGDVSIATLSFRQKDGNRYQVELNESGSVSYDRELMGQQWELKARMLKWSPIMGALGFKTGYRFDSIRGRYIELQMDKLVGVEQPPAINESWEVDVWEFLNQHSPMIFEIEAYISSPGYIPMADGAIFDIVLSGKNLVAKPMNDAAKNAYSKW